MSKFIQTQCGSFLNLKQIDSIKFNRQINNEFNECFAQWIANINNQQFELISFNCKKEDYKDSYDKHYVLLLELINVNR